LLPPTDADDSVRVEDEELDVAGPIVALASTNLSPPLLERDDELVELLVLLLAELLASPDCTQPLTVTLPLLLSCCLSVDGALVD